MSNETKLPRGIQAMLDAAMLLHKPSPFAEGLFRSIVAQAYTEGIVDGLQRAAKRKEPLT